LESQQGAPHNSILEQPNTVHSGPCFLSVTVDSFMKI
jgi:hypothetical protein